MGIRAYLLLCLLLPLGLTAAGADKHDAFCHRAAFSAAASEFTELLPIQHDYGCGDALEYRLLGDPSQYTYYWDHGPTTLRITDLAPGFYTFVVRRSDGCEKQYTAFVKDMTGCDYRLEFSAGLTPCDVFVTIIPFSSATGDDIDPANAEIEWSDGGPAVFRRLVSRSVVEAGTLEFIYYMLMDGERCCSDTGVIEPDDKWEYLDIACTEECDFTIELVRAARCKTNIIIRLGSDVLQGIAEPVYIVRWSDSRVFTSLSREVDVYDFSYTLSGVVTVMEKYSCEQHCSFPFTVEIPGDDRGCGNWQFPLPEDRILGVNEFGVIPGAPNSQYVEFLVTGNGECRETTDLRGLIIDDNNGQIIPPGEMIHGYNRQYLGINPGFLYFSYHSNWEQVPNGSLIVVYNQRDTLGIIPPDDPFDANEDGVYVLPAHQEDLFGAMTSQWNETLRREEYTGYLDSMSWNKIAISGEADGMQVRKASGSYVHGISSGESPLAAHDRRFVLWIGDLRANDAVCQLVEDDLYNADHFRCFPASEMMASPGAANSERNAALIAGLYGCLEGEEEEDTGDDVPEIDNPGIIVSKTANVTSMNQPGEIITYTITVTNTGHSVLTNVVVNDPLTRFTDTIPVLLPCESRTFTTQYEVSCKELGNINGLSNTATATGTTPKGDHVESASTAHVANGTILLGIVKTVSDTLPDYDEVVTFSLTLRNLGAATATGVSVQDLFPQSGYTDIANISHGGVLGAPVNGEVPIVWSGLTVPAGGTLTLTFDARVLENGAYKNCAGIKGSDQYNGYAPPCKDDKESEELLMSCVTLTPQGNECELGATPQIIAYNPGDGKPTDPSDDTYTVSIIINKPPGTPGDCWKFTLGGQTYQGNIDVPISLTFPVGTNWENVNVSLYLSDCETAVLCSAVFHILSPAVAGNFVWIDHNRDGLQNSNEQKVAGLPVTLLKNQTAIATATTNADGEYLFTNLDTGAYQVAFALPPNPMELVRHINFQQVNLLSQIQGVTGAGFVIAGNGATGSPTDNCARSTFQAFNNFLSVSQTLSADYEYRIRWNVKSGATDPAVQKIMQLRHSTTAGHAGTDIGGPFTLPQIAPTQPGHEYVGEWFGGLSGQHHLILTTAPGNSSVSANCYFDDFRLERRLVPGHPDGYAPTLQNVGNDDAIDSDINYALISDVFSLVPGQIRMNIDAGFVLGAFPALRSNAGPAAAAPETPRPADALGHADATGHSEDILVYPNPFAEYCRLKLSSSLPGDALISVYSPLSQQVLQTRVELRPGDTDTELPLPPQWPAGVYIVKVQFPSGSVLSRMMTKIRL